MRRGTQLIVVVASAVAVAGLAGCGSSLAKPEGGVDWQCLDVAVQPLTGTPCRFAVPPPPDCNAGADRSHIGIKVAGSEIPRDPNRVNGWDYEDETMTTIDIYGPSCDAITASPTTPVSIIFKLLL